MSPTETRLTKSRRSCLQGSYFENLTGRSQRAGGDRGAVSASASLGRAARSEARRSTWTISATTKTYARAPVSYLREDGTLLRQSIFPATAPFTLHNAEIGAYVQDRWQPREGLLVEPGLRFDWDEIVRRPLVSPRHCRGVLAAGERRRDQNFGRHRDFTTSTRNWSI